MPRSMIYQQDYHYILANYVVHDSFLFLFVGDWNTVENDLSDYLVKMSTRCFIRKPFFFFLPEPRFFNMHVFFYEQQVYKQPALEWQIVKQLSALNPFLLSNNKICKLKKSGVFPLKY